MTQAELTFYESVPRVLKELVITIDKLTEEVSLLKAEVEAIKELKQYE